MSASASSTPTQRTSSNSWSCSDQVAADRLHQEVVDGLVDARPRLHEPVLDGPDGRHDADLEPGLLLHLAERRLLDRLIGVGGALGQRPGRAVALAAAPPEDQLAYPLRPAAARPRPRRWRARWASAAALAPSASPWRRVPARIAETGAGRIQRVRSGAARTAPPRAVCAAGRTDDRAASRMARTGCVTAPSAITGPGCDRTGTAAGARTAGPAGDRR